MRPDRHTLLLLALVALVFLPVVQLDFASDDAGLVLANPATAHLSDIPTAFVQGLWAGVDAHETVFYRPMMVVSLAVDRALWGLSPAMHHLHSLAWHLAAVLGLVTLLRPRVGAERALVAGAVLGLHPVQTEAVAFVSARNDPMAAALCLAAALTWTRGPTTLIRVAGSGLLLFLALCAKETALVAAVGFGALALLPGATDRAARVTAVGVPIAVFLALRTFAVGAAIPPGDGGWELLASKGVAALGHYAALLWWPWPLSDAVTLVYLPGDVPWWALALTLVAAAVCVRRGGSLAVLGLALAVAVAATAVPAIASKKILPDRYLYFPMVGVATALAAALPAGRGTLWAAGAVVVPWIAAIGLRIPDWTNSLTLAEASARSTPSGYSNGWLAIERVRAGRIADAREPLVAALSAEPPFCPVGPIVVESAPPAEAVGLGWEVFRHGCAGYPDFRETWAAAHAAAGDLDRARAIMTPPPPPCGPDASLARITCELALHGRPAAEACAGVAREGERLLRGAEQRLAAGTRPTGAP